MRTRKKNKLSNQWKALLRRRNCYLPAVATAVGVLGFPSISQAEEKMNPVLTHLNATTLSGYVDTSMIWQMGPKNDAGRWLDGAARQNGFNLNVVGLVLDKPLTEGEWSAGYKLHFMAGPDGKLSTGNEIGIHNAFVRLHAPVGNGLDFKVGLWTSISGYEYLQSSLNPNYSYCYGFNAIEPGRQTGVLANYKFTDWVSVMAGVSDCYNKPVNGRPYKLDEGILVADGFAKTFMGGVTLTAPESMGCLKGAEIYAIAINGTTAPQVGTTPFEGQDVSDYFVGLTLPTPVKGLSFVLTWDYVDYNYVTLAQPASYGESFALYTIYKATPKLTFANRVDYATGSQGFFGGYTSPTRPRGPGSDDLLSETITVSYDLWANVLCRAEFRYDHDLDTRGGAGLFGAGNTDAYSLSLNVVYKF